MRIVNVVGVVVLSAATALLVMMFYPRAAPPEPRMPARALPAVCDLSLPVPWVLERTNTSEHAMQGVVPCAIWSTTAKNQTAAVLSVHAQIQDKLLRFNATDSNLELYPEYLTSPSFGLSGFFVYLRSASVNAVYDVQVTEDSVSVWVTLGERPALGSEPVSTRH